MLVNRDDSPWAVSELREVHALFEVIKLVIWSFRHATISQTITLQQGFECWCMEQLLLQSGYASGHQH